ncbi:MAG: transcription elongation factor GreAB [Pseudoalteromonadaceae bacterium]|uniref:GreA/GreB family elongation factor n=1 Tax=Pseudoalteromonas sp. OFAV1 TaxID=2908892 RepID=UPI000C46B603|nr:GreA/GreB family elongation factor [Pseudoalteromonas sp. OFAV1]MBU76029.1 transcription elongation factor GreAB [Pseudoalteromonadaceae bacterium]MCF2900717.1 GreA/GreB family elongation factor [Pseudoalteromonas sp. OFAV1]
MNKTHVIEHLRFALEAQLHNAKEAAKAAHDAATHEESVAETQYDTLGLEAAYLAQGQAERVNECYRDIQAFNTVFKESEFNKVREGALVCLIDEHDNSKWFFIGPSAGGLMVTVKQQPIYVVTREAPLGKQLIGKQADDELTLTIAGNKQFYSIAEIC